MKNKDRPGIPDMIEFLKNDIWEGIIDVKKAVMSKKPREN